MCPTNYQICPLIRVSTWTYAQIHGHGLWIYPELSTGPWMYLDRLWIYMELSAGPCINLHLDALSSSLNYSFSRKPCQNIQNMHNMFLPAHHMPLGMPSWTHAHHMAHGICLPRHGHAHAYTCLALPPHACLPHAHGLNNGHQPHATS